MDDGRRVVFPGYRVQHSSIIGPDEGRDPLRPRGDARRVRRARDVDDLEVRAAAPALRRREGRRPVRPPEPLARRARAADPAVHVGAPADHRPQGGHPGAGHGHERADDGLDDGHVLDAERLRRPGDRHREADLDRRLRVPARGDRRRRRHGRRARVRPARVDARRAALRRSGFRKRRRHRRLRARRARRVGHRRLGRLRRPARRRTGSTSRRCTSTSREHGSLEGCDCGARTHERRAARARLRHPRPRRARGSGHRGQRAARSRADDRRGRERPDVARSRRDPLGARDPGAAGHPHERRRRHGLVLRVGAGSRPALLDARRDPREARREALERVRPRAGISPRTAKVKLRTGALVAGIREVSDALQARGIFP